MVTECVTECEKMTRKSMSSCATGKRKECDNSVRVECDCHESSVRIYSRASTARAAKRCSKS